MSTFQIITTLLVAAVRLTLASNANICSGIEPNSLVRNTQNCSTYYQCVSGNPVLQSCGNDLLFNHIARKCDLPHLADCFVCPPDDIFTDLPVANECQQFVRCYNNQSQQLTCANGLAFDRALGKCNLAARVSCPSTVECAFNYSEAIFTRDQHNCSKYTVCVNGEKREHECPEPLNFNPDTRQCDLPENTKCVQPHEEPRLVCPRAGGPLYAHPTNCSEAYACSKEQKPVVYPCREGLFFDYKHLYCGPQSFVQCIDGSK